VLAENEFNSGTAIISLAYGKSLDVQIAENVQLISIVTAIERITNDVSGL
jgi:hypothetical protein